MTSETHGAAHIDPDQYKLSILPKSMNNQIQVDSSTGQDTYIILHLSWKQFDLQGCLRFDLLRQEGMAISNPETLNFYPREGQIFYIEYRTDTKIIWKFWDINIGA